MWGREVKGVGWGLRFWVKRVRMWRNGIKGVEEWG